MGEWSGRSCSLKFDGNSICLRLRYPDEKVAFLLRSFQDDHSLLRCQIDTHAINCHLYHKKSFLRGPISLIGDGRKERLPTGRTFSWSAPCGEPFLIRNG